MLCFRLLNEDEPAAPLAAAVDALRQGQLARNVFDVDPASYRQVPNAPFAYWVSEKVRRLFSDLPSLEGSGRDVESGASTKSDFRFLRLRFERPEYEAAVIGKTKLVETGTWVPFAKGGAVVTFYGDPTLTVNWQRNGAELKALISEYRGSRGWGYQWTAELKVMAFSFRPGVTWGRRSTSLAFRLLPANTMFADKGPAILLNGDSPSRILALSAIVNSRAFAGLAAIQLARAELAQSFEVGLIQRCPFPVISDSDTKLLAELAKRIWSDKRQLDSASAISHAFVVSALASAETSSLLERSYQWKDYQSSKEEEISQIQTQIDCYSYSLYGIHESDRTSIEQALKKDVVSPLQNVEQVSNDHEDADQDDEAPISANTDDLIADLLDYTVGCAFGRWDIRYATGAKAPPPEPDPFDPLPFCPPGMLQNAAGLPAAPAEVAADYPLPITWSGILVDDPHQPTDIERRVREVFAAIYGEHADARVDEAVTILGTPSLRDYLLKPAGFFAGHLKRHSKSRRQAPIYWPLSSPKGLTTVWLYYHRLTPDTFFTVIREHIKPRLDDEERRLFNLKQQAGPSATPSQVREIGAVEDLVEDLRAFRDELQRIAPLWRPDLNDGVIINHAPLWRVANHAPWRKALKETWEALVFGKYDWAHLALHLWPDRVIPKCAKDRSLAIAHDLESFFWGTDPKTGEIVAIKRTEADVQALITERTSPAVKAALESLLTAPASAGGTAKRGRKKA